MPKTIGAADRVRRSGCPPDVRCRADDLLQGLAAVECYFIAGGAAAVPAGLLRDLVVITAALAGRTWVETHADKTAVFALHSTWQPPPLPELDQILADALSTRLPLIRPDEPCLPKNVSGDGGLDVLVAGQPRQPDRLIDREQPEYVVVQVIAGRRGWPEVTGSAEVDGHGLHVRSAHLTSVKEGTEPHTAQADPGWRQDLVLSH